MKVRDHLKYCEMDEWSDLKDQKINNSNNRQSNSFFAPAGRAFPIVPFARSASAPSYQNLMDGHVSESSRAGRPALLTYCYVGRSRST